MPRAPGVGAIANVVGEAIPALMPYSVAAMRAVAPAPPTQKRCPRRTLCGYAQFIQRGARHFFDTAGDTKTISQCIQRSARRQRGSVGVHGRVGAAEVGVPAISARRSAVQAGMRTGEPMLIYPGGCRKGAVEGSALGVSSAERKVQGVMVVPLSSAHLEIRSIWEVNK